MSLSSLGRQATQRCTRRTDCVHIMCWRQENVVGAVSNSTSAWQQRRFRASQRTVRANFTWMASQNAGIVCTRPPKDVLTDRLRQQPGQRQRQTAHLVLNHALLLSFSLAPRAARLRPAAKAPPCLLEALVAAEPCSFATSNHQRTLIHCHCSLGKYKPVDQRTTKRKGWFPSRPVPSRPVASRLCSSSHRRPSHQAVLFVKPVKRTKPPHLSLSDAACFLLTSCLLKRQQSAPHIAPPWRICAFLMHL